MLTGERPPYLLGKLSGGCSLMGLLCPGPKSSFLYQPHVVIPFSRIPFYPHGFAALMLRVGAISYAYKKIHLSWILPFLVVIHALIRRAEHVLFLPGPRQYWTESFSFGNACPIQSTGWSLSFNHFLVVTTHWVHTDFRGLNGVYNMTAAMSIWSRSASTTRSLHFSMQLTLGQALGRKPVSASLVAYGIAWQKNYALISKTNLIMVN